MNAPYLAEFYNENYSEILPWIKLDLCPLTLLPYSVVIIEFIEPTWKSLIPVYLSFFTECLNAKI